MNTAIAAEVCDRCGVADGAIGNWNDGHWIGLARLFDLPKVTLPVPVRYVQLREVNGQMVCQRCAGETERMGATA